MAKQIEVGSQVKFRDENGKQVIGIVRRTTRTTSIVEALGVEWNLDTSLLLFSRNEKQPSACSICGVHHELDDSGFCPEEY